MRGPQEAPRGEGSQASAASDRDTFIVPSEKEIVQVQALRRTSLSCSSRVQTEMVFAERIWVRRSGGICYFGGPMTPGNKRRWRPGARTGPERGVALNMIEIVALAVVVIPGDSGDGGPQALIAWLRGRSWRRWMHLCGPSWARRCRSGRTYVFLREAYVRSGGPLMSFCSFGKRWCRRAFRGVGVDWFRKYAGYLYPFTPLQAKAISGGLVS